MFAKRSKTPAVALTQLSSLIAEDVEITGDICFSTGIRIDGRVRGNVIGRADAGPARALLVLSEKGRIEGNISCGDAVINGAVVGDLHIGHFLELQANAQVTGAIHYAHLQMAIGASVHGQLHKAGPAAAEPAPIAELAAPT
jgi:cytoskeletal protein CcmA (bactofilin family)